MNYSRVAVVLAGTLLAVLSWAALAEPTPGPAAPKDTSARTEKHWAYIKPVRPEPPAVKNRAWVRNPIDAFILARLEKEGLGPSPEAPKEALIRRVSLDLIGLPPSPAEVDAFVNDASPDAYEKLVDQLLASPRYGERWARPWLDLARYADSNGYEKDNRRTMWKWRDWVIDALNADMSFKQFTIEQIAGDMLPHPTTEQRIATGFHRNTMLNEEGGVDPVEARWLTQVDRVGATAQVWLGATLQCAQCHDHKYDPFTQKDFYGMLAFWENADEPNIEVLSPEQERRQHETQAEIAKLAQTLAAATPELSAAQAEWEKTVAQAGAWTVLDPTTFTAAVGTTLKKQADGSVLAGGAIPVNDTYTVTATTPLRGITGFRLEVLADPSLPAHGPGAASNGNFVLSDFKVSAAKGTEAAQPVALNNATADFSQDGWPVAAAIDANAATGWAVSPQFGKDHAAVFETVAPVDVEGGVALTFTLDHHSQYAQHNIGRFRLSATTAKEPAKLITLPAPIQTIFAIAADQRTEAQKIELAAFYRGIAPALQPTREKVTALQAALAQIKPVTAMVFQERPGVDQPATDLRIRGSFLQHGEKIPAQTPAVLGAFPKNEKHNRLGLARWLVDDENPLVARVTVNRYWEAFFGHGIVETTDDFGTQGEAPTHPELLDWLATEFMRNGWSMKAIQRTIVTSATYRQSTRVPPAVLEKDPYNRLLAHGSRFRMDAEMLRDASLSFAGLLSPRIGGPSAFPPQPDGIWDLPYNGDQWVTDRDGNRFRRGIYTFWRRSAPYPTFISFDAPSREFCTVRRLRTNTPLQAMSVLNDPAFVEAAKGLARRLLSESKGDVKERASFGFRLCTARAPKAEELDHLVRLYEQELEDLKKDPPGAAKLANGVNPPAGVETPEAAAWAVVANVLLNLDETLTKG